MLRPFMKGTLFKAVCIITFLLGSCNQGVFYNDTDHSGVPAESRKLGDGTITLIVPEDLEVLMRKEQIQLVDVRTKAEWQQGHLLNAQNFEINNPLWEDQLSTLDKEKPVYLYCAKGVRSRRSARRLKKMGFLNIYDLKGGISAWLKAGKPLE